MRGGSLRCPRTELQASDASLEAISGAFNDYAAASDGPFRGLGCLMCNTAVERGALAPGSLHHVDSYLARLEAAFRGALTNAVKTEEIDLHADVDHLAAFFTMALIGVAACVRAEAPAKQVRAACEVATGVLFA